MAYWITHTIIADKVLEKIAFLDEKGFCIGNIAPDCNVENEDWTAFEPPREVTHFMSGKRKNMADCDSFYDLYIKNREFSSNEHFSFILGYYSHLITDVKWIEYMRDEDRVEACFERIKNKQELRERLLGLPEEYDTIKQVFGKRCFLDDVVNIEHRYILENPDNSYCNLLRRVTEFENYLDFLPDGAIARKIGIMAYEPPTYVEKAPLVFYTVEEYERFIVDTSELICGLIKERIKL